MGVLVGYRVKQVTQGLNGEVIIFFESTLQTLIMSYSLIFQVNTRN